MAYPTGGKAKQIGIFTSSFQRREAAIALATMLNDPNSSPVGWKVVRKRVAETEGKKQINVGFQVLPSDRFGGFGQYYSGCLYQLGLTHRLEDGMDRVTEGVAETIARTVNSTLAPTAYIKDKLFTKSVIDRSALEESSERLGLDAIALPSARAEQKLLLDLFFGFPETTANPQTIQRRLSLTRILLTVQAYEKTGIPLEAPSIEPQVLYAPSYFGVLTPSKGKSKRFNIPESLLRCSEFWRQFCLHQFLTQGLEGILAAVLQLLDSEPAGISLPDISDELSGRAFNQYLADLVGAKCDTPQRLLAQLGLKSIPDEAACLQLRQHYGYDADLNESICKLSADEPAKIAARCCVLLALLYGKWRGITTDVSYRVIEEKAGQDIAAPSFLPLLDSWLDATCSWKQALTNLIALISEQHDAVMYSKGKLESCWLHLENKRLIKDQDYASYFRASRHLPAIQILIDLGLLKWTLVKKVKNLQLTGSGREVLNRVIEENAAR